MHPKIPTRPHRLRAALLALLLAVLGAAACTRGVGKGEERSLVLSFGPSDGPRTPEGARLEGEAVLRVAPLSKSFAPDELDALVRFDVVSMLEKRIADQGLDAARAKAASDVAWILARDGVELRALDSLKLAIPGAGLRANLAPTTDLRILLVGLDGFDWDIAEPLMAAGRMPALSGLVARGARARLQTIQPVLSPVVWTSMATSRSPKEHGILDFLGTDAKGEAVPVTSNLRRKKAFWNVFSDAGVPVGVVGWWATWPAEPVDGFLVSDRVAYQLFQVDATKLPTAGKIHPPALWDEVGPLVVRPADVPATEIRAYVDTAERAPMDAQDRQLLEQLSAIQAQAKTYAAISLRLHEEKRPRVGAYYFESPDTTCHLFMRYASPPLPEVDPARQRRYANVVDRSYEFHDRLLARFLEAADANTVVMVASDHGFRSGTARPAHDSRIETPTAADWHERFGVFVAAGPGIRQGVEVPEASVLDVFPTMLRLLGMPVAADLEGHVLTGALTDDFAAAHPQRSVPTFETEPVKRPAYAEASAEDRAIIESLVAIGYVGKEAVAPAGASGTTAPGGTAATANVHNNTGTVLLEQGDLEAAVAEFSRAVNLAPSFAPARINLAHALVRLGRTAQAETQLESVLATDPANAKALALLSSMQLDGGKLAKAESLARTAVASDGRSAPAWYTLGQVLERSDRPAEARTAFERAAELDPDNPEPLNAIGNSHEGRGEHAQAVVWYEKALAIDPTFAAGYNNLGLEYQRIGRREDALRTYEEGRRRLPSSSILLNNLATWHHLAAQERQQAAAAAKASGDAAATAAADAAFQAEAKEAAALYEEAMKANPLDPSAVNNLGALRGLLGDADEQLRLYRRAVEIDPRYVDAWHNVGLWHHDRKRWQEAHDAFQRALSADPDYVPALRLDAHSLFQLGRKGDALKLLGEAANRHPRSAALLTALGGLQDELGDAESACRTYRASLAASPDQGAVRARIAAICGR